MIKKNDPSVSFADSSPCAGEPRWCAANLHCTCGARDAAVSAAFSTPGDRNHRIGDCAKAPLKKTANQIGVGGGVFDLDTGDELGLRVEYL